MNKNIYRIIDIDIKSRSLFIFSHDNILRQFCKNIVENQYFDQFIYYIIALNSFLLAINEPSLKDIYQI